ncbi:MAG: hypothetical protein Q4C34_02055 [Bacteroidales bacterium]|nr:hypothetical protein [Bacteroidales bacterium]
MKKVAIICLTVIAMLCASCSKEYDAERCKQLSFKIETRQELAQQDYADMISQSEHILRYLIDKTADVSTLPAARRSQAEANMRADDDFLERFGYMFTFSSVLYRAHLAGLLDADNTAAYEALDHSADRYARLCENI